MASMRLPRDRQRGNSLLLALVVMSALATLGSLTVVSVQSSLKTSTNDRSQTIAMYAAESGAAVAMDFLRTNYGKWSDYLAPIDAPLKKLLFRSNDAQPGDPNNLFAPTSPPDYNAWYSVEVLNNHNDPGYLLVSKSNTDTDNQIIIRSTGHGPQGSVAIVEWEVRAKDADSPMILLGWRVVL
jgi:hypothetical protein